MKKYTIFLLILFFSMNCANINQFIDVDDMLTVQAGVSKQELLTSIGKPSMVRAGLMLNNKDLHEVWVYKVKENLTRQVLDYNRLLPAFLVPGMKPKKDFKGNGWSGTKMYGFMFKNDKLYKWGFLGDDWPDFQQTDGDYINPKSKGSKSKGMSAGASGGLLSKIPLIGNLF